MIQDEFINYALPIKLEIDNILKKFYRNKINDAKEFDSAYKILLRDIANQNIRGGKRLRPILAVLGYELAGGINQNNIYKAACALEIFHNYLLIHDDIMDRDDYRHAGLNISGLYKKKLKSKVDRMDLDHLTSSIAILGGDISAGLSSELLLNADFSDSLLIKAQQRLNRAIFEVAAGQYLDVATAHKQKIGIKKILKIYSYKTADYSITLPLQFGGILAGADSKLKSNMAQYGQKVGVAFQLMDDILGMYKKEKELGKPIYSDLREGKQTVLMYYGFLLSSADQKELLNKYFKNKEIGQKELLKVRKILDSNGAKTKTQLLARQYVDDAINIIPHITSNKSHQLLLQSFAEYCIARSK